MVKTLNLTAVLSFHMLEVKDLLLLWEISGLYTKLYFFLPNGGCPELFRFSDLQWHTHRFKSKIVLHSVYLSVSGVLSIRVTLKGDIGGKFLRLWLS